MGYYLGTKETMDNLRIKIEDEPEIILNFIEKINQTTPFRVEGEKYKKLLNKNIEEPLLEWYQKKNIYLMYNAPLSDIIYKPELADKILNDFIAVGDLYKFFRDFKRLKFDKW